MNLSVSHDRNDESIEAKTLWFRSLPLSERMEMLCAFTELAMLAKQNVKERYSAQSTAERIQIISAQ